jgi:hypothetical protein
MEVYTLVTILKCENKNDENCRSLSRRLDIGTVLIVKHLRQASKWYHGIGILIETEGFHLESATGEIRPLIACYLKK